MYEDFEDLMYWNDVIEKQAKSRLSIANYCRKNKVPYKTFNNMKFKIVYKRDNDPILYQELLSKGRAYLASP